MKRCQIQLSVPSAALSTHPEAGGLMKRIECSFVSIEEKTFQPTQRREG